MRVSLEFNLPEEKYEFETACRASNYRTALIEIYNILRDNRKYDLPDKECLERITDVINDIELFD